MASADELIPILENPRIVLAGFVTRELIPLEADPPLRMIASEKHPP